MQSTCAGAVEGGFTRLTLKYLLRHLGKPKDKTIFPLDLCKIGTYILLKQDKGPCAGADEGGFAWLTLNYLLGHLGKPEDKTIAAIDLGGGSVQQAFAVPPAEAAKAPAGYITKLAGGGRTYNVYVHR